MREVRVEARCVAGIDGQQQAGREVERDGEEPAPQPQGAADEQHRERLRGDRDRRVRQRHPDVAGQDDRLALQHDLEVRGQGDEDGAGDDQRDVA